MNRISLPTLQILDFCHLSSPSSLRWLTGNLEEIVGTGDEPFQILRFLSEIHVIRYMTNETLTHDTSFWATASKITTVDQLYVCLYLANAMQHYFKHLKNTLLILTLYSFWLFVLVIIT